MPSVRNVAAEYRVNPLTVLKGYQELVDEQLVEKGAGWACSFGRARAIAAEGRAAEISCGTVAAHSRDHSAAGVDAGRAARGCQEGAR